jgi:hypothetical protein
MSSAMFWVVLVAGLAAALLFVAGFCRGVAETIRGARAPSHEVPWTDHGRYAWSAFFAVFASALIIGLVGVSPIWIYAGPLLAIVTAAGVGLAFFMDEPTARGGTKP